MTEILRRPQRPARVVAGFDGYVDSILRVCRTTGAGGPEFFREMGDFGGYIRDKAGKSCSLELRLQTEKIGGNAPIFSQTMAGLGAEVSCIGAFGRPGLWPVFRPLEEACRLYSICEPGTCQALEFDDGKVMLARNDAISVDYATLTRTCPPFFLLELAEQADLLAFFNWSELPGSTSIWRGYLEDVLPGLSRRKRLFIDLSDCSQRRREEVREAGGLLREFDRYVDVVLSLNLNEAETLSDSLGLPRGEAGEMAAALRSALSCQLVAIHLLDGSLCAHSGGLARCPGRRIASPLLSTGGGDNFNAGFAFALLQGLGPEEALAVGNGVSGFYVSQGRSPGREELADWLEGACNTAEQGRERPLDHTQKDRENTEQEKESFL